MSIQINKNDRARIIENLCELWSRLWGTREEAGYMAYYLHIFILVSIMWLVFVCESYFGCVVGVMGLAGIASLHLVFDGCFMTRMERELLNDKTWTSVWSILLWPYVYFSGEAVSVGLLREKIVTIGVVMLLTGGAQLWRRHGNTEERKWTEVLLFLFGFSVYLFVIFMTLTCSSDGVDYQSQSSSSPHFKLS